MPTTDSGIATDKARELLLQTNKRIKKASQKFKCHGKNQTIRDCYHLCSIDCEFSIGSAAEQLEHREMMKNMGSHTHDSGSTVTVKPGKAKQMLWHFHGDNHVEFACNIPGHAEAGMVKSVTL